MPRSRRPGRPPVTTRTELESVALDLFNERGFEATTVGDVAAAAGISRRSYFRYFASKNDVLWGDFDALLSGLEGWLAESPGDEPTMAVLARAVIRFNQLPPEAAAAHRQRMAMILHVPALQAHSALRYAEWRGVIARFGARRMSEPAEALAPQLLGHLALAAAVTAYEQWLRDESADLASLLATTFAAVRLPERLVSRALE